VPAAGQANLSWATAAFPSNCGFRWHVVRSRRVRGGEAMGLASGSRSGDPEPGDEARAFFAPVRSDWAWHRHRVDVPDCLPTDVLSLWVAPDCPGDPGLQSAARLLCRDLGLTPADEHLARHADTQVLHDAALNGLPFHDSAPLETFAAA